MSKKQKIESVSEKKRTSANINKEESSTILSPSKAKNWGETERSKLREYFDLGEMGLNLEQGGVRADFFKGQDGLDISKTEYARRVRQRHSKDFLHCPEHRFN